MSELLVKRTGISIGILLATKAIDKLRKTQLCTQAPWLPTVLSLRV